MSNAQSKRGILDLICKAVEICMPNLRHYYRMPKKGKIVSTYPSAGGQYWADVQLLRNDETEDPDEPIVSEVEIPIHWAGPKRGVVCPPEVGTYCVVSYFDGDPAYPFISHFRWHEMDAPEADLKEFLIQLEPGVEIRIDKEKQIVALTPSNWIVKVDGDAKITAGGNSIVTVDGDTTVTAKGNVKVSALGGSADITAASQINLTAPTIKHNGMVQITGSVSASGNMTISGNSTVSGNSDAATRTGGSCPH